MLILYPIILECENDSLTDEINFQYCDDFLSYPLYMNYPFGYPD